MASAIKVSHYENHRQFPLLMEAITGLPPSLQKALLGLKQRQTIGKFTRILSRY